VPKPAEPSRVVGCPECPGWQPDGTISPDVAEMLADLWPPEMEAE